MNPEERMTWCQKNAKKLISLNKGMGFDDMDKSFSQFIPSDCRVLSLGESSHGTHEQTQFRVRLLEYLVEKHGFRAFVMESGFLEGFLVDRFIQGDETVNLKEVLAEGITHYMGGYEEVKEIVMWMKEHNTKVGYHQRIHFYGMDNTIEGEGLLIPFNHFINYVGSVDQEFIESVEEVKELRKIILKSHKTIEKFSQLFKEHRGCKIDPDLLNIIGSMSYSILSDSEKESIIKHIRTIAQKIDQTQLFDKQSYIRQQHLLRMIEFFKQTLDLRAELNKFDTIDRLKLIIEKAKIPLEDHEQKFLDGLSFDKSSQEDWSKYFRSTDPREENMIRNLNHITRIHAKVMITAHNTHISKEGINTGLFDIMSFGVGHRLSERWGKKYLAIGASHDIFVNENEEEMETFQKQKVEKTGDKKDSLEYYCANVTKECGMEMFILDWSKDDEVKKNWLDLDLPLRYLQTFKVCKPSKCFDGYFFTKSVRSGKKIEL